jgi:D-3-phosphoglycerate dehydrogenase
MCSGWAAWSIRSNGENLSLSAKPIVVLTNPIHPQLLPSLEKQCEVVLAPDTRPETLARLRPEAEGLIVRAQLAPSLFDHAPKLRAVVRHGVGLDMIPVDAATARGIPVANLPGSNTQAVAEYCLAAMLHLRRRLAAMDIVLRHQGWAAARPLADNGTELRGSTCGIVGVGAVGRRLADIASALGMHVIGLTRRPETLPAHVKGVDKPTLLKHADVLVLCCPLNDETRGLIDAAGVSLMKPDAVLINVSRGPVIEVAAVLAALHEGRLGGAALDVHDKQPLGGKEALFDAPNLLHPPHVAGDPATSMRELRDGAVATLVALLRG